MSIRRECRKAQLEWIGFPIDDFEVPEDAKVFSALIDRIIGYVKKETPVCVHCQAGVGRTGLVLACVLGRMFGLDGKKAIAAVNFGPNPWARTSGGITPHVTCPQWPHRRPWA